MSISRDDVVEVRMHRISTGACCSGDENYDVEEFFLNEHNYKIVLLRRNDGDDVPQHHQHDDEAFVER
jgi:hypothetical protein